MKHLVELGEVEKIILTAHKHWFVFLMQTTGLIFAGLLPIVALVVIMTNGGQLLPDSPNQLSNLVVDLHSAPLLVFIISAWLTLLWLILAATFADYYLDALIITSERLIDIEQLGFFSRDVATIPLGNIQDIKLVVSGFFPTLLHYGNLHVQTAGAIKEVIIANLPHPEKLKEAILTARHIQKPSP